MSDQVKTKAQDAVALVDEVNSVVLPDPSPAEDVVSLETASPEMSEEIRARMDEIDRVERGAFAFKPSNGFLVHLKKPGHRAWQPGLWWRMGRKLGIGGVTPAGQAKFMADMIALRLRGGDPLGFGLEDAADDAKDDPKDSDKT